MNLCKKIVLPLLAATVALSGALAFAEPATTSAPAAASAPASRPAPDPIIASVGGAGLPRDAMVDILIAVGGLRVLDEYWGFAVVMQALDASGIKVTPEDAQRIKDDLVAKLAPGQTLSKEDKDKLIYQTLAQRGIATNPQMEWYFATYAGLQILAERNAKAEITPTADELKTVEDANFGLRAVVYDYIVRDEAEGAAVIKRLNNGDKPEVVAQAFRCQATTVAKADKNMPEVFQKEIWDVLQKPGAYSKLARKDPRTNLFHVLYLQSIEQPKTDVKEEDRQKVRNAFAEQKAANWRAQHLNKLKMQSLPNLRISDPILRNQFSAWITNMQRQAEAANGGLAPTSAPAPATGAAPKAP